MQRIRAQKGFTLVEMSIVLAIIGLLTGGILIGKSIVRQTQINNSYSDVQHFITAAVTFRQKYGQLPGDFSSATSYWGAQTTCPPVHGSASQGTLTCNGDGNGQTYSILISSTVNSAESLYFWQHLSDAGLIPGAYTGIGGGSGGGAGNNIIGVNVPAGRLPGLGYYIQYEGTFINNWARYDGVSNHIIGMGALGSDGNLNGPILTTLEAQSFDTKFDDGLPAGGVIRSMKANYFISNYTTPYCAKGNTTATAVYNTKATDPNSQGLQCSFEITTGF